MQKHNNQINHLACSIAASLGLFTLNSFATDDTNSVTETATNSYPGSYAGNTNRLDTSLTNTNRMDENTNGMNSATNSYPGSYANNPKGMDTSLTHTNRMGMHTNRMNAGLSNTNWTGAGTNWNDSNTNISNTGDADNSGRNVRDRNMDTRTPWDQGNSREDIRVTREIRRAVISGTNNFSMLAQNIKIITRDGHVVLRGPVDNENEKMRIVNIAGEFAGTNNVKDLLEVKMNSQNETQTNSATQH